MPGKTSEYLPYHDTAVHLEHYKTVSIRYGGWIPANPDTRRQFFNDTIADSHGRTFEDFEPAVQKWGNAIQNDSTMSFLFEEAMSQRRVGSSDTELDPEHTVKDFDGFLKLVDGAFKSAPRFGRFSSFRTPSHSDDATTSEPIVAPFYVLFDLLSNTDAGHTLFSTPEFNAAMKELLDTWGNFLKDDKDPRSRATLVKADNGWFSPRGLRFLQSKGRDPFGDLYVCDPADDHYGFKSWDHFFTRELQPGKRNPESSDPSALLNACESTVYRIVRGAKSEDRYWLKGQPYSIRDIFQTPLNKGVEIDDKYAELFEGGTVYQAFLGPDDYHRWHSPISGTVKAAVVLPGTYYSAITDEGDPNVKGLYSGAVVRSQAYLTAVATRAVIIIESDNEDLGNPLVAFIGAGMFEVSTCDIGPVKDLVGKSIKAGDEIGMFHFGGSTHALIIDPKVKVDFIPRIQDAVDDTGYPPTGKDTYIHVKSLLGYLRRKD